MSTRIPPETLRVTLEISEFPSAFLEYMAIDPGAFELSGTNLALAYGVAVRGLLQKPLSQFDDETVSKLSQRPHGELCRLLGFPNPEKAVRILSKIEARAISVTGLKVIAECLKAGIHTKALMHLRKIDHLVLDSLKFGTKVSRRFLIEASEIDIESDARSLSGLLHFFDLYCRHNKEKTVLRSIAQANRHLPEWLEKIPKVGWNGYQAHLYQIMLGLDPVLPEFPFPPFPGSHLIRPISTYSQLLDEGRNMEHCIADDLPPNFHPAMVRVWPEVTPVGAR